MKQLIKEEVLDFDKTTKDIQGKFIRFKEAEQELFMALAEIDDEERLMEILERLNKIGESIGVGNQRRFRIKKIEKTNYIG